MIRVQGVRRLAELQGKGRLNWEEQEELALLLKLPPGLHVQGGPRQAPAGDGLRCPSVVEILPPAARVRRLVLCRPTDFTRRIEPQSRAVATLGCVLSKRYLLLSLARESSDRTSPDPAND